MERRKRGTDGKAFVSRKEFRKREMLPEPISTALTDTSFIEDQLYYQSFIQPAISQLLIEVYKCNKRRSEKQSFKHVLLTRATSENVSVLLEPVAVMILDRNYSLLVIHRSDSLEKDGK